MKKKGTFWIIGLLILLFQGSVLAEVNNRIVAIVNNEIITYYELEKSMKNMLPQDPGSGNKGEQEKQLLFQLIDHKLVDLQVKKYGIQVLAEELDKTVERIRQEQGLTKEEDFKAALAKQRLTEKDFKERVKNQILRYKLISREIGSKIIIPKERIQEFYQKNKTEFQRSEGVHLAHIILRTGPGASPEELQNQKRKAEEIRERLVKGEDFSELARTFSQDSSSAQGGDLGVFKMEEIDASLRAAISQLKPGEISPVMETPQGFQMVKLISRQGEKEFTFDEVKDRIQDHLFQMEVDQRFSQWLQQLKDRSYIQILL